MLFISLSTPRLRFNSYICSIEITHPTMKHVTLHQLLECIPASSNYTFTAAPDSVSHDYDDNMWNDLVCNLIDYCGGDADRVAKTLVNHFDAEGNYLETYALELTPEEREELMADCEQWRMEEM